jgi:hypothetical protein
MHACGGLKLSHTCPTQPNPPSSWLAPVAKWRDGWCPAHLFKVIYTYIYTLCSFLLLLLIFLDYVLLFILFIFLKNIIYFIIIYFITK